MNSYNLLNKIRFIFLFLFKSHEFIGVAEEHSKNKVVQSASLSLVAEQTNKLRAGTRNAFITTLASILLAGLIGWTLSSFGWGPSKLSIYLLQGSGAAILLFATLAEIGWVIESIDGDELPELVNKWIFRFLYFCGTCLLFISFWWDLLINSVEYI
jgi:heme A synthase